MCVRQGQHEKASTLRLLSKVWVVSHEKGAFLLEECLLRATISVVDKDGAINLGPVRREDIVNLPLLCLLGILSIERQLGLDRPAFGRGIFGFKISGSLS